MVIFIYSCCSQKWVMSFQEDKWPLISSPLKFWDWEICHFNRGGEGRYNLFCMTCQLWTKCKIRFHMQLKPNYVLIQKQCHLFTTGTWASYRPVKTPVKNHLRHCVKWQRFLAADWTETMTQHNMSEWLWTAEKSLEPKRHVYITVLQDMNSHTHTQTSRYINLNLKPPSNSKCALYIKKIKKMNW